MNHQVEWCLVIPADDMDHPDTRIGIGYTGVDLHFARAASDEA